MATIDSLEKPAEKKGLYRHERRGMTSTPVHVCGKEFLGFE